jgi:SAM-dependent methyltransferase
MFNRLNKISQTAYVEFIAIGLSCHALCLIEKIGLLKQIKDSEPGCILISEIENYNNPHLLKSAFATLIQAKIIEIKNKSYFLTDLGIHLSENIGALMLPFSGYQKLLSKQFHLIDNSQNWSFEDIDFLQVALASIQFGKQYLEPVLLEVFNLLSPQGTICDLGCGSGEKLSKICQNIHSKELGIEQSHETVKTANKMFGNNLNLEIIQGDIMCLDGTWEDVEVVFSSFVYHDIPTNKTKEFLLSLKQHFPRVKHTIIVDIVSPSDDMQSIMHGFDYVHGLQGFSPRNYKEALKTFSDAKLKLTKEIAVPNMPNTYIWVIQN